MTQFITVIARGDSLTNISFKYAKFDQQLNCFAQSRNIAYVEVVIDNCNYLSSFSDIIGINDTGINNVKSIRISKNVFPIIDFPGMNDLKNQLEI